MGKKREQDGTDPYIPFSKQRSYLAGDVLFSLAIFLLINVLSHLYQQPVRHNFGIGWDGTSYLLTAVQIQDHQPLAGEGPYVFRVGTPFLAVLAGAKKLVTGFFWVNLLANLLTAVLFALWLALWLKERWVRYSINFLFQADWISPIRMAWFFQVSVDQWTVALLLLGLLILAGKRTGPGVVGAVAVLGFLGVFFREVLFSIPLSFLFMGWEGLGSLPLFFRSLRLNWVPLAAAVVGWGILTRYVVQEVTYFNGYQSSIPFLGAAWYSFLNGSLTQWYLAWMTVFGPCLYLVLARGPRIVSFFRGYPALGVYSLSMVVLSVAGGHDTERFLVWLSPMVFLFVGLALEEAGPFLKNRTVLLILFALQVLSERCFWTIPTDEPIPRSFTDLWILLSPLGKGCRYLDLYSWYAPGFIVQQRILQYLLVGAVVVLAYVLLNREKANGVRRKVG